MSAVPPGNYSLFELVERAVARKYGKEAVAELEVHRPSEAEDWEEGEVEDIPWLERAGKQIDVVEDIGSWNTVREAVLDAHLAGKLPILDRGVLLKI